MKKKVAAVCLTLLLVLSLFPVGVFAEGTNDFAGQTVILTGPPDSLMETPYAGSWGVILSKYGAGFGIRFKENNTAIPAENISFDSHSLPTGFSLSAGGSDYLKISVAPDTVAGSYTLAFSVNQKTALVVVSVSSNSGGGQENNKFMGETYIVLGPDEHLNNTYSCNQGTKTGFGVRFKENGEYVTNITAPQELPAGVTITVQGNTADVITDGTTPTGSYNLNFTVNGKTAAVQFSITSNGGTVTPVVVSAAKRDENGNYNGFSTLLMPLTLWLNSTPNSDVAYYQLKFDDNIVDQNTKDQISVMLVSGSADVCSVMVESDGTLKVQALKNGTSQYQFAHAPSHSSVSLTVTVSAPITESTYKNAYMESRFVGSTDVVYFTNIEGELTAPVAGFSLINGTLQFECANKPKGSYEVEIKGKKYVVNMIPTVEAETFDNSIRLNEDELYTSSQAPEGLFLTSGSNAMNIVPRMVFQQDAAGNYYPIYIAYGQGGTVKDLPSELYLSLSGQYKDFFRLTEATVQGKRAIKIAPRTDIAIPIRIDGMLTFGDRADTMIVTVMRYPVDAYGDVRFSATLNPDNLTNEYGGNPTMVWQIGESYEKDYYDYYLYQSTGSNVNMTSELLLNDRIDLSTLKFEVSKPDVLEVTDVFSKTVGGKNAIGFRVKTNTAEPNIADLKISFIDKLLNIPRTFYISTQVKEKYTVKEYHVKNVQEFKESYSKASGGGSYSDADIIYLAEGSYAMDITMTKPVIIRAEENAQVIITGAPGSPKAIVSSKQAVAMPIKGVTIDGGGNRAGVEVASESPYQAFLDSCIIRNCTAGVKASTRMNASTAIKGCVIENCATALEISLGKVTAYDNLLQNNGQAVRNSSPDDTLDSTYLWEIYNNRFVNNAKDLAINTGSITYLRQNYFGNSATIERKPVIKNEASETGKGIYSPYFADYELTTLTADIAGSKMQNSMKGAAKALTVPVDRTRNTASIINDNLFLEMKQAKKEKIEVFIPITEQVDTINHINKTTTIWSFNNEQGNLAEKLPEKMNLEIKDTLSQEAQNIVDAAVKNKDAVMQYVNFTHDGVLPGYATVKILKNNSITKENLKLFYINQETGKVEQAKIVKVTEQNIDGEIYYVVTVDHCSEYIIAAATLLTSDNTDSNGTGSGNGTPEKSPTPTPVIPETVTMNASTKKPVQATANNLTSAIELETKFKNSTGDEVEVNVAQKPLLSSKAFEILSRHVDKNLVLKGKGYQWMFKGTEITNPSAITGSSFDATINLTSPNREKIAELTAGADVINIYFNYHGTLPGPAQVTLNIGQQYASQIKHLYYYNDKADNLEYLAPVEVTEIGEATFTIYHCSDYLLANKKIQEEDQPIEIPTEKNIEPSSQPGENIQTTVSFNFIPLFGFVFIGTVIIIMMVKNKKKGER